MTLVIIRANPHDINPAIPRALEASRGSFDRTCVLCWNHMGLPLTDSDTVEGVPILRFNLRLSGFGLRAVVGVLWYQLWVLGHLLRLRPRVVQALDLYSMVPAAVARLLLGCRLIYDMRDPFALSFDFSAVARKTAYAIDWLLMGLSTAFVVPERSRVPYLGRWGRSRRAVAVVLNTCHDALARARAVEIEPVAPHPKRQAAAEVAENAERTGRGKKRTKKAAAGSGLPVRIAFLGYVAESRGLRSLLDLCRQADSPAELWVAGTCSPPSLQDELQACPNVRWWGRCPWLKCLALIREADVVAILYDPKVAVNRMAAPNKLYESLMLGRPVLVAKGMELGDWVQREGLGYVVAYNDVAALKTVVQSMADRHERSRMQQRCRSYFLRHLTLDRELEKYRAFYRARVGRGGPIG